MGIKNLKCLITKYAPGAVNERYLSVYENKVIAIDLSIYLYRFIYKNGEPLELLTKQIMRLLKNRITPLYVFDGKPPKEKSDVLDERNERKKKLVSKQSQIKYLIEKKQKEIEIEVKDKVIEDEVKVIEDEVKVIEDEVKDIEKEILSEIKGELQTIIDDKDIIEELMVMNLDELKEELEKVDKGIIIINSKIISDCKKLFKYMGVPYLVANGEAETLCAKLSKRGLVHGCLSEDTDILANGSRFFIRNFNVNNNKIIEYDLQKVLKGFGLSYEQFLDVCILCGCDYTSTIKNIGIEKALKFVKEYGNIEGVIGYVNSENKKNEEKNKDSRYIVPKEFNYKKARELFLTMVDTEDYDQIRKSIKLSVPQFDSLLIFLEDIAEVNVKNDIKRNLKKFHNIIESSKQMTLDSFYN